MTRIGIVDDDQEARTRLCDEIARFAAEYHTEFDVAQYDSAAAYLAAPRHDRDLLYLDIDMPEMSGMELAEKIRETDQEVLLIFCTNLQQFALNGYAVSALGFIVKPIQWYSFRMYLERALKVLQQRAERRRNGAARRIVLKDGAVSKLVDATDIEYVEVRQHELLYHLCPRDGGEKSVIKNRGTMQEIAAQLAPHGFVRCNASFLVNLRRITAVSRMNVYLGQESLPIGRAYKASFTEAFSRYLAKRGWDAPC